ncbi:MAG: tetratricopeptide repeat protein [Rhizobiaceae bacterium]
MTIRFKSTAGIAFSLCACTLLFSSLSFSRDINTSCGVGAGGNVTAETIKINCGLSISDIKLIISEYIRLEEAVAAFRAALEERTRDRVPLDWAATQNNLGNALSSHGDRDGDAARLEEAVVAYRAALEEWTLGGHINTTALAHNESVYVFAFERTLRVNNGFLLQIH